MPVRISPNTITPERKYSPEARLPVYSFNAEGLWLPGAGGGKQVGDSKKLSRWQDLLKKMRAEGFP